jgi:hypothetical protein
MGLTRTTLSKFNKYCHVVDDVAILKELGFEEDGFHNWNYVIYQSDHNPHYSKSIVAAGDYLYVRDNMGRKREGSSLCTLWNRDIAGTISKNDIESFINLLKQGNVRAT